MQMADADELDPKDDLFVHAGSVADNRSSLISDL
jgi:hypothetical protein